MEVLGQLQGMLDFDRPLIAEALRQVPLPFLTSPQRVQ